MNIKLLVVSFLAFVLIGLYIFSMIEVIKLNPKVNAAGIGYLFSGIGGLVTAFALSFLAVSESNKVTTTGLNTGLGLTDSSEVIGRKIEKAIPVAFVLTWLICGALAVYFGLISSTKYPESMTEMGKGWIGTVIAAVGAFFGVDPKKS